MQEQEGKHFDCWFCCNLCWNGQKSKDYYQKRFFFVHKIPSANISLIFLTNIFVAAVSAKYYVRLKRSPLIENQNNKRKLCCRRVSSAINVLLLYDALFNLLWCLVGIWWMNEKVEKTRPISVQCKTNFDGSFMKLYFFPFMEILKSYCVLLRDFHNVWKTKKFIEQRKETLKMSSEKPLVRSIGTT